MGWQDLGSFCSADPASPGSAALNVQARRLVSFEAADLLQNAGLRYRALVITQARRILKIVDAHFSAPSRFPAWTDPF